MRFPLNACCFSVALMTAMIVNAASAHSTSDAYLTMETQPRGAALAAGDTVIRGQWDIALRDLHFVLRLDDDGDGNITWGELRKHMPEITRYAYPKLRVSGDGKACAINPVRHAVSNHADGAYVALYFDVRCTGAPSRLQLDYRLLFAIDPSHRGIMVLRSGANTATSLLAPENATIEVKL